MTVELLTEHHLARLSLHLSKCHIVGNLMPRLKSYERQKNKTTLHGLSNTKLLVGKEYRSDRFCTSTHAGHGLYWA